MAAGEPERIQDLPKFLEQIELVDGMSRLLAFARFCSPLLKLMGVDTEKLKNINPEVEELKPQLLALAKLPDRFNAAFGQRGWIAFEQMNIEVALKAVEMAESGNPDAGEQILVDHYSAEELEVHLRWMRNIKAFFVRLDLLELARQDHAAGRYHACIPVVLSQIDGLVSDVVENNRGFFADGSDLRAWDCMAGHSSGLSTLSDIMKRGVQKTTKDAMTIPYRNGILHGRSLGYNNQKVSAKTWAALFSIREWALKVEAGTAAPTATPAKPGLKEMIDSLNSSRQKTAEVKELCDAWVPRSCVDLPVTVTGPEQFPDDTPEHALATFFTLLKKGNFGHLTQCLSPSHNEGTKPGYMREVFESLSIVDVQFTAVNDEAPALTEIDVTIQVERDGELKQHEKSFRLIHHAGDGSPMPRNGHGKWGLVTWEFYCF